MPNSILWIGLVALWLFVLFPMLAGRHPRVRRTTDAALATRVLHRGGTKRIRALRKERARRRGTGDEIEPEADRNPAEDGMDEADSDSDADEFVSNGRGHGRLGLESDTRKLARRYVYRQRIVLTLLLTVLAAGLGGFVVPAAWWAGAGAVSVLACYLVYLRRQARLEREIHRRRLARLARARHRYHRDIAEHLYDQALLPALPPALVVLEPDDEDPVFDHLTTYDSYLATHADESESGVRRAVGE